MGVLLPQLVESIGLVKEYIDETALNARESISARTNTDLIYESDDFLYTNECDLTPFVKLHRFADGERPLERAITEYQMLAVELSVSCTSDAKTVTNTGTELILNPTVVTARGENKATAIHLFNLSTDLISYDGTNYCLAGNVNMIASTGDDSLQVVGYKATEYDSSSDLEHTAKIRVYGINHMDELIMPPPVLNRVELLGTYPEAATEITDAVLKITLDSPVKMGTTLDIDTLGISSLLIDSSNDDASIDGNIVTVSIGTMEWITMPEDELIATMNCGETSSSYTMTEDDYPVMTPKILGLKIMDPNGTSGSRPESWSHISYYVKFNQPMRYTDFQSLDMSIVNSLSLVIPIEEPIDTIWPDDDHSGEYREFNVDVSYTKDIYCQNIDSISASLTFGDVSRFPNTRKVEIASTYRLSDDDVPKYANE